MDIRVLAAIAALGSAASTAVAGPEWVEKDDAGPLPITSARVEGTGPVTKIKGSLQSGFSLLGEPDFVDMFLIQIDAPTTFFASTVTEFGGTAPFDSQLWLFDANPKSEGFGLLGNNDTFVQIIGIARGGKGGFVSTGSSLGNESSDGTEIEITKPGLYYLAISTTDSVCQSARGNMFSFTSFPQTEISGPDGPGGGSPISNWVDVGERAIADGSPGAPELYEIKLTGVAHLPLSTLPASLDIRPGICPNNFNVYLPGVLVATINGTATIDPALINVDSLTIARSDGVGGSVAVIAGSTLLYDLATPYEGDDCGCHALGGDGSIDLYMKFDKQQMIDYLEFGSLECGAVVELVVSGTLMDGTPFEGLDCIVIVD